MERFLFLFALLILLMCILTLLQTIYARSVVTSLADEVDPAANLGPNPPRLSLIVPACNEEGSIAGAVRSMLAQDYPNLEVILVNDRSTDRTGEIMAQLAREWSASADSRTPSLRVIQIETLPPGWLSKNHALYVGAQQATGDWLLFADADVHFDPTTFRRAVAFAEQRKLDHLTIAPSLSTKGYFLPGWVAFFTMAFLSYKTPYKANDPKSRVGMGIGAFNLIRRRAYEQIGTHRAISLRPDDDLRLGQRVKRAGLRQYVLLGDRLMSVEWYTSLGEAIRGLEKNTFAGMEYNLGMVIGSLLAMLAIMVWPFLAIFFTHGVSLWLYGGAILLQLAVFALSNDLRGGRILLLMPGYPIYALLFIYTITRSTWLTLRNGGITWRGTFYPLKELRSQIGLQESDDAP